MIIDPRDPHSPICGHSPTVRSDRWAIAWLLIMIAVLAGGLMAMIAYGIAITTKVWGWW